MPIKDNPLIFNSIFWQNPGMDNNEITVESGTAEIAFSDLDTNLIAGNKIIGAGMINADPIFSNTSLLTIDSQSPCFDKGVTEYNCVHGMLVLSPAMDILGIPRPLGQGIDMGAYEASVTYIPDHPITGELSFSAYPNPVNDHLFIDFELNTSESVIFTLYDITGTAVKSFTQHTGNIGNYHVVIELRDLPAGIYLLRIQAGVETGSRKVIRY